MDCSSSCKPPLTQVSAPCLGYEALSSPKCSNMQQTLCLDQGLLICRCVLQARKAYFQVRKQAEAKKWHMIHGETNTAPAGAINEGAANHGVFGRALPCTTYPCIKCPSTGSYPVGKVAVGVS
eukprot:scaffold4958_cov22-Tisochrysis_lutea.AAC.1